MRIKMAILPPEYREEWPDVIRGALPDAEVRTFHDAKDAREYIEDANCAYGYVSPELFADAKKLEWIQCYAAGPDPSFWHEDLVNSKVVVTNFRGIYNDLVAAHAMALVLAFGRNLHSYIHRQLRREWNTAGSIIHLPGSVAVIIGVGGIGSETARLCASFGMKVIGVDPRLTTPPDYVSEVHPPEELERVLPMADFLILTAPETPQTRGMVNARSFGMMKPNAIIINVGRGACIVLDDLVDALRAKRIGGAGLDVFQQEPLLPGSPLWGMDNVIITPHVAALVGDPRVAERRTGIIMENCKRFAEGRSLLNVVDKKNWF